MSFLLWTGGIIGYMLVGFLIGAHLGYMKGRHISGCRGCFIHDDDLPDLAITVFTYGSFLLWPFSIVALVLYMFITRVLWKIMKFVGGFYEKIEKKGRGE